MYDIFQALDTSFKATPGAIACVSTNGYVDYQTFARNLDIAGRHALALGVKPGDTVLVKTGHHDARLMLNIALMRLGCRICLSHDLNHYASNEIALDVLISSDSKAKGARKVLPLDGRWFQPSSDIRRPPATPGYSVLVASSGSTGVPKLIEFSEATMSRQIGYLLTVLGSDNPRFLSVFGDDVAGTLQTSIITLIAGGTVLRPDVSAIEPLIDAIQLYQPTLTTVSPATLTGMIKLLEEHPVAIKKLEIINTTGAQCSPDLKRKVIALLAKRLHTYYGATEIGGAALGFFEDTPELERSVGRIKDDVEVITVDGDGKPLPQGAEGEILIRVPKESVARYVGKNAARIDTFKGGWFAPGDIGRVDANRNLILLGRIGFVINYGGHKVDPELMEAAMASYAGVKEFAVVGIEGADGFHQVHAAIVSRDPIELFRLNQYLQAKSPDYLVHVVRQVDAIPHTASGKVDRQKLKSMFTT